MPLLLLLVLFIAVPLAELYVIIRVGGEIGVLPTIGILLLDSILGSLLLRSQGREVWRRFNAAMGAGRVPHREIVDGVMVIAGGALLLTPGFMTDVLGLALLLPPTRAVIRRVLARRLLRRMVVSMTSPPSGFSRRPGGPPASGWPPEPGSTRVRPDVEGTYREAGNDELRRPD